MQAVIEGLMWGELISQGSKLLRREDRSRVRLRAAALALVGLPPVIGVADATREVRRIERVRRRPIQAPPKAPGGIRFLERGRGLAEQFGRLATEAKTELEHFEKSLSAAQEALEAKQKSLEDAKADAKKLFECAETIQDVFDDDGNEDDKPVD